MKHIPELYFKTHEEWYSWLEINHKNSNGVHLILYKVDSKKPSMRWEEAVKVALCFGWIDSTVKKLDEERRRQYFCPRKPKSTWSKVNKDYVKELIAKKLMQSSGLAKVKEAKKNGSWTAMDDIENLVIPQDLQNAFDKNVMAYNNYLSFSKTYKKGYLYWLKQAKREETRKKRIQKIIKLCEESKRTPY